MRRRVVTAMLGAVVALVLSGCAAASPFDGRRIDDDRLPGTITAYLRDADPGTSRFQGTAGGWDLYLVHGTGPGGFCLGYTDGTPEQSGASCTGGTWVRVGLPDGAAFEADVDGFAGPPQAGQTEVSSWVRQVAPARGQ
jgi:hypothetical protein